MIGDRNRENHESMQDIDNSPIQLIDQLRGYYYINPVLSFSLAITLFSFAGVPPLIGFFGKQMILSAAIDSGYIFMSLIAILTSVISAVYYLAIIKQIFFDTPDYKENPAL
jgi:NADH-ubiquinone oxidoreductase chain 2